MPREIKVTNPADIHTGNKIRNGDGIHGHGTIVKAHKDEEPKKSMCTGCYENFYNGPASTTGECWSFKEAVVVDKIGHENINICNGPNIRMRKTLDCWHGTRK